MGSIQLTGLKGIQQAIVDKKYSHQELVLEYLQNIKASENCNAYIEVFEKEALGIAKNLDTKLKNNQSLGSLHGAIISIKDNIVYKDHVSSAGSKMLDGVIMPYHSTVVQRLIDADAIIIGRTNCDEFGMGSNSENEHYGPVRNGINHDHIAGGSSGGAAVSVQMDTCLAALGSDTGGSVRQPAAYCGCIGLKPGYGTISRWGLVSYGSSFDQIGIIAKNENDISRIFYAIAGPDGKDSTAIQQFPIKKKHQISKIGVFENLFNSAEIDQRIKEQSKHILHSLTNDNIELTNIKFPFDRSLVSTYYTLVMGEASSNLSRYDGIRYGHNSNLIPKDYKDFILNNRTEGFGLKVKRRILAGTYILCESCKDDYFLKAQTLRKRMIQYMEPLFDKYDLIAIPCTLDTAPKIGEEKSVVQKYRSDIFTVLANIIGFPAISVPIHTNQDSWPFAIQFISNKGEESKLLEGAKLINSLA